MKKALRSALVAALAEQVPAVLGAPWQRLKPLPRDAAHLVLQGEIVYADRSRPPMGRFVAFIPDQKAEAFTVELGWSADGQFPSTSARPSTGPAEAVSARAACGFVRLTELYSRLGERWDAEPIDFEDPTSLERFMEFELRDLAAAEAAAMIAPLVAHALEQVRRHAPDFFAALSDATGSERG